MSKVRNYIFLGLLAALFVEVVIVFPLRVEDHPDGPPPAEKSAADSASPAVTTGAAEQKISGLHLVETQNGARDWELFATEAEGGADQGRWALKDARVLFYSNDRIEFTVTGRSGVIETKTKDMLIKGDVTTESVNGYVFKTEEVRYDANTRKIASPSAVLMRGPRDQDGEGMRVEGQRMEVDVETSRMVIPADVRGEKALSGGRKMKLTSRSAEFSGKSKQARFIGDVLMEYDRVRLEGPEASFLQSGKGNFLSNIGFSGGVKVSDGSKFATSEKLNLDLVLNRFVFTGKPKVYEGDDELSGEQIIFLEGGKKVRVEKVKARMEQKQ